MGERSEIRGRRKNGELFPAEASISHLEIGRENLFTVVLRDISERKRVEELLAKSNSELEARVSERTRELNAEMQRREQTQAQLVRTQRMEAFGQLTGGVAHDFNNILTVITGNLELLEMRLTDEKDRTLLKRAYDAAEMGARLTARLLTFARRRQYETARLNLNDQVMGMVDLLGRTLGEPIVLDTRFDAAHLGGARRSQRNRECHPQPRHQRARCHAARRPPDHRDRQRIGRGRRGRHAEQAAGRRLRPLRRFPTTAPA